MSLSHSFNTPARAEVGLPVLGGMNVHLVADTLPPSTFGIPTFTHFSINVREAFVFDC